MEEVLCGQNFSGKVTLGSDKVSDFVFKTTYLFVRKDARGRGIAGRLLKYSRTDGADCGFRLTRLIATNHYT